MVRGLGEEESMLDGEGSSEMEMVCARLVVVAAAATTLVVGRVRE